MLVMLGSWFGHLIDQHTVSAYNACVQTPSIEVIYVIVSCYFTLRGKLMIKVSLEIKSMYGGVSMFLAHRLHGLIPTSLHQCYYYI